MISVRSICSTRGDALWKSSSDRIAARPVDRLVRFVTGDPDRLHPPARPTQSPSPRPGGHQRGGLTPRSPVTKDPDPPSLGRGEEPIWGEVLRGGCLQAIRSDTATSRQSTP